MWHSCRLLKSWEHGCVVEPCRQKIWDRGGEQGSDARFTCVRYVQKASTRIEKDTTNICFRSSLECRTNDAIIMLLWLLKSFQQLESRTARVAKATGHPMRFTRTDRKHKQVSHKCEDVTFPKTNMSTKYRTATLTWSWPHCIEEGDLPPTP